MTVIFINSKDKTIKEYKIDKDNFLSFAQTHAAEYSGIITYGSVIYKNIQENIIYVDDEGLLEQVYPLEGFEYKDQFYAGNAVITGVDVMGETISTNCSIEEVEKLIKFTFKTKEDMDIMMNNELEIFSNNSNDYLLNSDEDIY